MSFLAILFHHFHHIIRSHKGNLVFLLLFWSSLTWCLSHAHQPGCSFIRNRMHTQINLLTRCRMKRFKFDDGLYTKRMHLTPYWGQIRLCSGFAHWLLVCLFNYYDYIEFVGNIVWAILCLRAVRMFGAHNCMQFNRWLLRIVYNNA